MIVDHTPEVEILTKMFDEIIEKMDALGKEKNASFPTKNRIMAKRSKIFAKRAKMEMIAAITTVE